MKKTEWNEGLSNIDIDLVEEYIKKKEKLAGMKKRSSSMLRYGVVAACIVLVVGTLAAVPLLKRGDESKIPMWDNVEMIIVKAKDAATVFGTYDTLGTREYTKVYATSKDKLSIDLPPDVEYLPIYSNGSDPVSEERFEDFIDKYLKDASLYFDVKTNENEYDIIKRKSYIAKSGYCYKAKFPDVNSYNSKGYSQVGLTFEGSDNELTVRYYNYNSHIMSFDDPIFESDTDDQIKSKVKELKKEICERFGKNYSNIKIVRDYSSDGFNSVRIYLYTENENMLIGSSYRNPIGSDYAVLVYTTDDNAHHWGGSSVNEAYLSRVELCEGAESWDDYYKVVGKAKMLSLKEAEALLEKGYVFGNHICELCAKSQDLVDFTDYDCVGFEYISDNNAENVLPFYTFYKHISENEYGISTYAKTYVPAIELEGLDEYFANQEKAHQDFFSMFEEIPIERVIE